VVVSKLTTKHHTRKEVKLRRYFSRNTRKSGFPEALGFEELETIRAIKEVKVEMVNKRRADAVPASDARDLELYLETQLREAALNDEDI
jgi:hypothetical protein